MTTRREIVEAKRLAGLTLMDVVEAAIARGWSVRFDPYPGGRFLLRAKAGHQDDWTSAMLKSLDEAVLVLDGWTAPE